MDRPIEPEVRRRRLFRRVAVAVVSAGAVFFLIAATVNWLRPSVKRRDLQFAKVEVGADDASLQATGTVVPAFEQAISSPVEARVMRIDHRAGDQLRKGDEILTLDTSASRLDVDKLAGAVRQRESALAELRLKLEESIANIEAQIEQKKLDGDIDHLKLEQSTRMHAEGLVSKQDKLTAETAEKKTEIEIEQLKAQLARTRRSAAAQLTASQSEVGTAQRELAESQHQLDLAMTKADRDGVLTWVVPDVGATVRRGDLVARIADLTAYRVLATISDIHASHVAAGMRAKVNVDDATSLEGTVASVDPRIENGMMKFYVDIDARNHPKLRNNLRVDVLVVTGGQQRVLRVKRGALAQGDREDVFVVRNGRLEKTPVRWGLIGADYVEAAGGLRAGDEVVTSNMSDYNGVKTLRLE
jgi:HlyD family secretion protein